MTIEGYKAIKNAIQVTPNNIDAIKDFFGDTPHRIFSRGTHVAVYADFDLSDDRASDGDWIIKDIHGQFFICKNSIFREAFKEVTAR